MKKTELFYNKFENKSTVISNCWKEFIDQEWQSYFGFEATIIPSSVWKEEKILRIVNDVFPMKNVGIIKLHPYYNYDWHVDTERGCGINMLLQHEESHSLFRENEDGENGFFTELKYEPNTFYAFNTQKLHCVYNFGKPRYLFTCEFEQEKFALSYEMLCEWMKQNKL